MEKDLKDTIMETLIWGDLKLAKLTETEFILGIMEKYTMENGIKVSSMAMAFGKE